MLNRKIASLSLALASFAGSASAYDFSAADQAFAAREQGPAAIQTARAKYEAALPQVAGSELIYAVEKISRLFQYELNLIPESDKAARKQMSSAAFEALQAIAPDKVGANPQYYFWRTTHLLIYAKANGVMESLSRSKELLGYINEGRKVDATYEGGGFDRLGAILYAKLPALNPWGPAGDKVLAKELFEKALNSPAYSKEPEATAATESGDYFFGVYFYYAELLSETGKKDEAKALLTAAIERLEQDNDYPAKRIPETKVDLTTLKELLSKLP